MQLTLHLFLTYFRPTLFSHLPILLSPKTSLSYHFVQPIQPIKLPLHILLTNFRPLLPLHLIRGVRLIQEAHNEPVRVVKKPPLHMNMFHVKM